MILSAIVNGALVGGLSALVALGLSLTFGVLKMINLAHGEFVIVASFLAFSATTVLGVPLAVAVPLVVILAALAGFLVQKGLFTGLLKRGQDGPFVASFGLSLLLQGILLQLYSSETRSLMSGLATSGIDVLGIRVRSINLIAFVLAIVLTAVLHWILTRTRAGASIRAAAADAVTASTLGVNVNRLFAVVMAAAAGTAALAGVVVGIAFGFSPTTGTQWLMIGMVVVVLGGIGNVLGTFVAAVLLGILQSVTTAVLGGSFQTMLVYTLFLTLLALRPQGIFSAKVAV